MWYVWEGERCILEGNKLLGRPRRRWEYNNEIDLQEIGLGGSEYIYI